ncbi:frataxin [Plectosphaerella plurivora]|uniref:ferroxidase n=1 Tax=Plectosphaerella plurivora TaxID=936078 RepID=A0A9P8V6G0_9PEZI|nr:frataxin [Plectosphaerella plurivora]
MARSNLMKLARAATSRGLQSHASTTARRMLIPALASQSARVSPIASSRKLFTTSANANRGIMPDTDDPHGKAVETPESPASMSIAELSDSEYHELADQYLDVVVSKLEEAQEKREGWDVEFSAGVLTITTPNKGIYVVNKQPPNKQIWLSSPISGPKRYDWVLLGEGQAEKEGTGAGNWIYLRDGSTLDEVLLDELEVDLSLDPSTYGQ